MKQWRPLQADGLWNFDFYKSLARELCEYLQKHGDLEIRVSAFEHDLPRLRKIFDMYSAAERKSKCLNLLQYRHHCVQMISAGISLKDQAQSLKYFSAICRLKWNCQQEVEFLLEPSTFVEIYDLNYCQRYRSPEWLAMTSYGILNVEQERRLDLFIAPEEISRQRLELIRGIYEGSITKPVYRPVEIHTSQERRSSRHMAAEVETLIYAPVYDANEQLFGQMHVFRIYNLRSLKPTNGKSTSF